MSYAVEIRWPGFSNPKDWYDYRKDTVRGT